MYLWRFPHNTRNFPGWQFVADKDGCQSLLELLDLMRNARWSAQAEIRLNKPTEEIVSVPGWPHGTRWTAASVLLIRFPKGKVPESHWRWDGTPTQPRLNIGIDKLRELRDAIAEVAKGFGDFCVTAEDSPLHGVDKAKASIWFW